jgi:hypothetical protein
MAMKLGLLIGMLAVISSVHVGEAAAAAACYEDRMVPAGSSCSDAGGNSVDFTTGCAFQPEHIERVTVECPPATWVPTFSSSLVGKDTISKTSCKNAGMGAPTSIDGLVCKSDGAPNGGKYVFELHYESQSDNNSQMRTALYCYTSSAVAPPTSTSFLSAMNPKDVLTDWACAPAN